MRSKAAPLEHYWCQISCLLVVHIPSSRTCKTLEAKDFFKWRSHLFCFPILRTRCAILFLFWQNRQRISSLLLQMVLLHVYVILEIKEESTINILKNANFQYLKVRYFSGFIYLASHKLWLGHVSFLYLRLFFSINTKCS